MEVVSKEESFEEVQMEVEEDVFLDEDDLEVVAVVEEEVE